MLKNNEAYVAYTYQVKLAMGTDRKSWSDDACHVTQS